MFDGLLYSGTPLILASLGALVSELGGSLAIFIEGFMVTGAFFSFLFAVKTHSLLLSAVLVFFSCGLAAWGIARLVRALRADPFIAALAFNLFANGFTASLSQHIFGSKGTLRPDIALTLSPIDIPLLRKIPLIGNMLLPLNPLILWTLAAAALLFILLRHTKPGLRLLASGANPEAVRERGLRPEWYREVAWAAAGAFAGLAGAALTFRLGVYAPGNSAGRGWIALAAVYLGGKTVPGVAAAALLFAAAERIAFGAQALHPAAATALLGLPSFIALLFFSICRHLPWRRGGGGIR
ncbi:MAG: ABC transporter permease [Spirochaetaceae bacterium]|jgi:simple sugar transport system permease protein|nr:ABC transporter permease [Spirochaetaceae bacterium]